MFSLNYATQRELENLNDYAYHGVDKSIFAKLLGRFWNTAILYIPKTLAPNAITLIGLMFMILSFSIQIYYTPKLEGYAPTWVYLLNFFCLFTYQTMDALDGKQARRTKSSSPLGELFDHGCDAVTTSLLSLTIASTLQIGTHWSIFFILLSTLIAFYLAQLEEYHTGTLELWYFNVTEAQLFTMLLYLLTAFLGPQFWNELVPLPLWLQPFISEFGNSLQSIFNTLHIPLQFEAPKGFIATKYIPALMLILGVAITILSNFGKLTLGAMKGSIKLHKVVLHMVPVVSSAIYFSVWLYFSSLHNNSVLKKYPIQFLLSLGFLFAFMVGRIVLARMCKQDFNAIQVLSLPAIFGAFNAFTNHAFMSDYVFVTGYAIVCVGGYLHLALNVIKMLTGFLGIKCFSIKKLEEKNS